MVSYHYQSEFQKDDTYTIRRPIVPLNINGFPFTGLLDSGSDVIVIPTEVADALNLETGSKEIISQMNGDEMPCRLTNINIEFGTTKNPYNFKAKALISDSSRIILGRVGFFDNFRITFDEFNKKVHFKPNKENTFFN